MNVLNLDALINNGRLIDISEVDANSTYIVVGVANPNSPGTKYPLYALPLGNVNGIVQESIIIPVLDETTAITTGTNKVTMRMPYGFTLTGIKGSLTTASVSGTFTVDVNKNGTSILSPKLTFDATEKTTVTATTPAVITTSSFANDDVITIDVDSIGGGSATGLKIYLIGHQ